MGEAHKRSFVKTVSWRICATFTTMTIVFLFTKKLSLSLGVGFFEVTTKMLLYYIHERAWAKISWGKPRHPLEELPVIRDLDPADKEKIREQLKNMGYIE